ncbi:SH3 domain-containing protein [Metabacillus sp. KIGAM252]|uniref:SH3 domain-containing protein n=1 Tax=Metabacillus flavus TaxID=2823519 RepID=A0ABS5LGJ8_9BACI|nr:SH3 domain-containing protein [Metabacillus flavus]MBS2969817.1 SH3 domain-containing protein [Metabacillus flavus]
MYKRITSSILCMILLFTIIPGEPFYADAAPKETAKILNDTLNIRKGPGLSYGIEAIARKDEKYGVIERNKDWVKLDLPGNRTGWAATWLVQIQSGAEEETIYSNAEDVRIRKGPGTSHAVVGTFPLGKQAVLVKKQGDWSNISYNGVRGWISSRYASSSVKDSEAKNAAQRPLGYITASSLNVRSAPSSASSLLGSVKKGTEVAILKSEGTWLRISYSGKTGWVSRDYVKSGSLESQIKTEQTGVVTAASLNVRNAPSLTGGLAGKVLKNEQVSILEEKYSWTKIRFNRSQTGWVSSLYIKASETGSQKEKTPKNSGAIRLISDGTNIRSSASVNSSVIARGKTGQTYTVLSLQNDWYKIKLSGGRTGYVAGWLAEDAEFGKTVNRPGESKSLKGKTIVIDPGHGGIDGGTSGSGGTLEKSLTMKTAGYLSGELQSEGANVVMTRSSDLYISLSSRVTTAQLRSADAFISLHYDSSSNKTVRGMTVYYYHSSGQKLALPIKEELIKNTRSADRGVRFGDYHVIRENSRPSILIELGYLSSITDEMTVNSNSFQKNAVHGITEGLKDYFTQQ